MAARKRKKKFIQGAIKRPGALTARKRSGETTTQAARRTKNSPRSSTLAKQQANFYLNVLKPANKKRKKKTTSKGR